MQRAVTCGLYFVTLCAFLSKPALSQNPPPSPAETPKVVTAHARQNDLAQTIKLPGTLIPDKQVALVAKVPGYVKSILVDKGDSVKKDQVIAELSAPELEAELSLAKAKSAAAHADLSMAQAGIELESVTHHRLARLHDKEPGAVAQEDVDVSAAKEKIAQRQSASAQAGVGVADADVERIKHLIDYLTLRAPFDGVVSQRFVDEGAFVSGSSTSAKPIVEITTVGRLRLVFQLPDRYVAMVGKGHAVRFGVSALPGKSFDCTVSRRSEVITETDRTMRVEADVDNAAGALATGMYADVEVSLKNSAGTVAIPTAALRTIDGKTCVLAVENGTVKKYPVQSLSDNGTAVVVAGQIPANAALIVRGPGNLAEGQHVDAQEEH